MRMRMNMVPVLSALAILVIALSGVSPTSASAGESTQPRSSTRRVTLRDLVDPSSRIEVQGRLIQFALYGQIRFDTLADLFAFIDNQAGRGRFDSVAAQPRQDPTATRCWR